MATRFQQLVFLAFYLGFAINLNSNPVTCSAVTWSLRTAIQTSGEDTCVTC